MVYKRRDVQYLCWKYEQTDLLPLASFSLHCICRHWRLFPYCTDSPRHFVLPRKALLCLAMYFGNIMQK